MNAILIGVVASACAVDAVALVMTAQQTRRGHALHVDARRLAAAQGTLVVGIIFWVKVALTPDIAAPWAAAVALVLASVAVIAARNPLRAGVALWTLAVVFPAAAVGVISLNYLLADGLASSAGGREPLSEMVVVALIASIGFFSGPCYSVGSLLGVGDSAQRSTLTHV